MTDLPKTKEELAAALRNEIDRLETQLNAPITQEGLRQELKTAVAMYSRMLTILEEWLAQEREQ